MTETIPRIIRTGLRLRLLREPGPHRHCAGCMAHRLQWTGCVRNGSACGCDGSACRLCMPQRTRRRQGSLCGAARPWGMWRSCCFARASPLLFWATTRLRRTVASTPQRSRTGCSHRCSPLTRNGLRAIPGCQSLFRGQHGCCGGFICPWRGGCCCCRVPVFLRRCLLFCCWQGPASNVWTRHAGRRCWSPCLRVCPSRGRRSTWSIRMRRRAQ